jgi:hypothetical protein
MQFAFLFWLGIDWHVSLADSLLFNFFTALACIFLCYTMQFYLPRRERYGYILCISVLLSSVVVFNGKMLMSHLYADDTVYLSLLKNSFPVRWGFTFLLIVCMCVVCVLWYSFRDQQEMESRKSAVEALNREAELFALRRQLQPHFLFNSLNSISALVGTRPEEARNMIQQLSDFLRGTINKDDNPKVTLEEELRQLELYLAIEQVRFGHRLRTEISTDEQCEGLILPALILQPLVENAIKFGLYDVTDDVLITVKSTCQEGELVITVENPFDQTTVQSQAGTGFGLASVKRRLYLLYARNDLVATSSTNHIFTAKVKIPQTLQARPGLQKNKL